MCFGSVRQTKLVFRQLLNTRKYSLSYRVVSYLKSFLYYQIIIIIIITSHRRLQRTAVAAALASTVHYYKLNIAVTYGCVAETWTTLWPGLR